MASEWSPIIAKSKKNNITKWNLLALGIVVAGGGLTMLLAQMWIINWSESGLRYPLRARQTISLPAGKSFVYYESPFSVPVGRAELQLYDPEGIRTRVPLITRDISFRINLTGLSGRAMWELDIPQAGEYQFVAASHDVASEDEIPLEDKIVFLKTPNSVQEAKAIQKGIMIIGGSITIVLTAICYLIHMKSLGRGSDDSSETDMFEGEFELGS
ncbi:MAG: hypothetical protein O7G85_02685 [Planctomycetota bacterium]|nr:hypothetical protein [Planctomycetota bacterium]